jgi:TolB protein
VRLKRFGPAAALCALSLVFFTLGAGRPCLGQTDVHLRITSDSFTRIKIGFAEPARKPAGDAREKYKTYIETLEKDLKMTGYFEIVEVAKGGLHAIVESEIALDGGDVTAGVKLADFNSRASVFSRRYREPSSEIVKLTHIVADDIVYALTGRHGIANTRVAFVAGEKGQSHLYMVDIDGRNLRRLTETPSIVMGPAWSPDGTRIAYLSYETGTPAIYIVNIMTMGRTRFSSFEGLNSSPSFSPDGRKIALTLSKDGNPEVYIISLDGMERKRLTYFSGIDTSPTWAPNGIELAYTSDRAGSPHIFVTDVQGLSPRRISYGSYYNTSPSWSPEGDLIAYVSRVEGRFQIFAADPFGISSTQLTYSGSSEDPDWSPDGMHLVFCSTAGGNSAIYIMNRYGGNKTKIFDGLVRPRNPSWSTLPGHQAAERAAAEAAKEPALPERDVEPVVPIRPEDIKLDNIHFEYDKYDLSSEAKSTLSDNARVMMEHSGFSILIEGHCDERGTEEYNLALGEKRALSARDYLVGFGIAKDRISVISYGEEKPADPRHNEQAWTKNRRARFVVSK